MPRVGFCAECGANVWLTEAGGCPRGHDASSISNVFDTEPQPQQRAKRSILPWLLIGGGIAALLVVVSAAAWGITKAVNSSDGILLGMGASRASRSYSELPRDVRMKFEDDYPGWTPNGSDIWEADLKTGLQKYVVDATPPDRDFSLGVPYNRHTSGVITAEDSVLRPEAVYGPYGDSLLDYLEKHYADKGHRLYEVSTLEGDVFIIWAEKQQAGPFTFEEERYDLLYRETGGYQWLRVVDPEADR